MHCARLPWLRASVRRTESSMLNPELRQDSRFCANSAESSCFSTRSQITRRRKTSVIACTPANGTQAKVPASSKPPSQHKAVVVGIPPQLVAEGLVSDDKTGQQ